MYSHMSQHWFLKCKKILLGHRVWEPEREHDLHNNDGYWRGELCEALVERGRQSLPVCQSHDWWGSPCVVCSLHWSLTGCLTMTEYRKAKTNDPSSGKEVFHSRKASRSWRKATLSRKGERERVCWVASPSSGSPALRRPSALALVWLSGSGLVMCTSIILTGLWAPYSWCPCA